MESKTYLTTAQLAERIHYTQRSIRVHLKDSTLLEGVHYFRAFGGRKILWLWEVIERDMVVASMNAAHIPMARGRVSAHG